MFFLQRKNWNAEYLGEGDFINLIFTPRLQRESNNSNTCPKIIYLHFSNKYNTKPSTFEKI